MTKSEQISTRASLSITIYMSVVKQNRKQLFIFCEVLIHLKYDSEIR